MTKAKTKGARRAAKKSRGQFDVADIPRREKSGRSHRSPDQTDARAEHLKARCRHREIKPTIENLRRMSAPWNGCAEGEAIDGVQPESERQRLWTAAQHIVRTWATYYRAHAIPAPYARCLSILLPVDEISADASSPPLDLRTDEERQRASVSAKMRVEGWLGRISAYAASECKQVVLGQHRCRDQAGLLAGLRVVADGLDATY